TFKSNPACFPSCSSMWSKNGMPVFADTAPVPSSARVTPTSTSLVVRCTVAVRLAAFRGAGLRGAALRAGIGKDPPQRLADGRILIGGSDGHSQASWNERRKVPDQDPA